MKFIFLLVIILFSFSSFAEKKTRIVTLAPNLTEIIYALDLENELVGNTILCDYPEKAKTIYKVGNYNKPDLERILNSGTNFILLTQGTPTDFIKKIKSYNIRFLQVNIERVKDLPKFIKIIGKELKKEEKANKLAEKIENSIISLEKNKKKEKSFLFILQFNPIYSFNNENWLGELFAISGLKNIMASSKISYPILNKEFLIRNRPDIIFVNQIPGKNEKESLEIQREKIKEIYQDDIKKIKIFVVPKDILVRPGPRIAEGIDFIESLPD